MVPIPSDFNLLQVEQVFSNFQRKAVFFIIFGHIIFFAYLTFIMIHIMSKHGIDD
jgi:hypothetical protein